MTPVVTANSSEQAFLLVNEMKQSPKGEIATPSAEPQARKDIEVIVPVLTYHYIQDLVGGSELTRGLTISPSRLEGQLRYLIENSFTTISPDELYDSITSSTPLPNKPVLLTFDDGYDDFFTNAYPLLKKYGLKATNFIPVGLLDKFQYMSRVEVKQLSQDPLITIGSHTIHHPDLTTSSEESSWDEIHNGKKLLEELVGGEVTSFAYPFGLVDEEVVNQVRKSGFQIAFTTQAGRRHEPESLLVLPRLAMNDQVDLTTVLTGFSEPLD